MEEEKLVGFQAGPGEGGGRTVPLVVAPREELAQRPAVEESATVLAGMLSLPIHSFTKRGLSTRHSGSSPASPSIVRTACFQDPPELRIALPERSARLRAVPETIEAEVLEIDGGPPPPPREPEPEPAWKSMRGKVLKLDRRWWPLWVVLGIVAVGLTLTVGVVVAAIVVVAKILGGILRFLTGGASPRRGTGLSRPLS